MIGRFVGTQQCETIHHSWRSWQSSGMYLVQSVDLTPFVIFPYTIFNPGLSTSRLIEIYTFFYIANLPPAFTYIFSSLISFLILAGITKEFKPKVLLRFRVGFDT